MLINLRQLREDFCNVAEGFGVRIRVGDWNDTFSIVESGVSGEPMEGKNEEVELIRHVGFIGQSGGETSPDLD